MYPFAHCLLIVCSMDEVRILAVYLQDVQKHLPDQGGQGEYLTINRMAAQLTGGRHVERNADEEKQQPPFDAPLARDERHQQREHESQHDKHGARNECLLNGLVDKVNIASNNSLGDVGQQIEQTLYLGGHPTQALLLEVVLVADFFVEDMNVWLVADMDFLLEQEGFQLAVFTSGSQFEDILAEPVEIEAHTRANKC